MTDEGYPKEAELEPIADWPLHNIFGLIDHIKSIWTYDNAFVEKWLKGKLYLELHTVGWSGNEDIIHELQKNFWFMYFHSKWYRGGHFYFEISPSTVGFKKVSEFSKKIGISKQAIHKSKEKYEWLDVGNKILMVRHKTT